jgi:hypothetical protein
MEELNGGGIASLQEEPLSDTVSGAGGKRDDIAEVKADGIFAMGVSTGGPAWSSSPSSSALTLLSA